MSHRYHPNPDNPEDFPDSILFDNCSDCEAHAETPMYSLDRSTMLQLWEKFVVWNEGDFRGNLTFNEVKAFRELKKIHLFLGRYTTTDPRTLEFQALDF